VDSVLALIREGSLRPSSSQIAERAGITQRTLFNQFGDMDTLYEAVTERHTERVAHLIPTLGAGSLQDRVGHLCTQLCELLEDVMNIRWVVTTMPDGMERFGSSVQLLAAVLRSQLDNTFDEELMVLEPRDRAAVLDLLEIETDPLTWRMRRVQQRHSPEEARDLLTRAVTAIVRGSTT